MIELIVGIIVGLVVTEILFWTVFRRTEGFFCGKLLSLLCGMWFGLGASGVTYLFREKPTIVLWTLGVIGAVAIFFGVNYLIHLAVKKNGK